MVRALNNWFRSPKTITITTEQPRLLFRLEDGREVEWKYDVVPIKLKMQEIQERTKKSQPGLEELDEFTDYLISQGIPYCNVDLALRIWSLVIVQFQQIAMSIAKEVDEICRSN